MPPSLAVLWFAVALGACADAMGAPSFPPSDTIHCPKGTARDDSSTSDQGWDYPGRVIQCLGADRRAEGPAIEFYEGAPGRGPTKVAGRYAHQVPVGTWTQYDAGTGEKLSSYVLDDEGSGTEELRDQVGHRLVGRLSRGERDGPWTFFDSNGTAVGTDVYAKGRLVRRVGAVPWDPPMIDPRDVCPTDAASRVPSPELEGCPAPGQPR